MMNREKKGLAGSLRRAYEVFCGLILLLAVFFSILEIIGRVGFNISYDFIIDFSVWLTVWAVLLIAGPLVLQGEHVSVDFLLIKLRGPLRLAVEILNNVTVLAFGILICLAGILLTYRHYSEHATFSRYFAIPMWIVELCIPLGMFIFTIYAVITFIRAIRRRY